MEMKRLLSASATAAAAALPTLSAAPGHAEDLFRSGNWLAFRTVVSTGQQVCGMESVRSDGSSFFIKYYEGNKHLTGQVIKASWRFPASAENPIKVPMTIGVDRNPILTGDAFGYSQPTRSADGRPYQMPTLEFAIFPERTSIDGFLNDFSVAAKFWLRFDEGSEPPWVLDMSGSAKVTMVFRACALALIRASKGDPSAPQPYGGPQATQPYGKPQPTQPYGGKTYSNGEPPRQPGHPVSPDWGSSKSDDGGI